MLKLEAEEQLKAQPNNATSSLPLTDLVPDNRLSSDEIRRGGFQYVLCPEHSQHMFYCNCGMEIEDEMVFCDCCLEWYHTSCASFNDDGTDKKFVCPFCFDWFNLKDKILKEIKSNKAESYELKLTKNPKFYVPDFIVLAIICDLRLNKAQSQGSNINKIIKTMELYPLKSSRAHSSEDKKASVGDNINFDEIDEWISRSKDSQQVQIFEVKHIEELWDTFEPSVKTSEKYIKTRINYLTIWTTILKNPPQGLSISFWKVRGLLYEYYEILRKYMMVSTTIMKTLKEPILYLENLLDRLNALVDTLNKVKTEVEITETSHNIDGMDVSELVLEAKVFLSTRKVLFTDVKVRRPYSDLNRFYQDFRKVSQNLLDDRIVYKEEKKTDLKRPLPPLTTKESEKGGDIKKKLKREESDVPEKKGEKLHVQHTVTE